MLLIMFEYISFFILVFTSLVGIFSLAQMASEWLFDRKRDARDLSVLTLLGHVNEIEIQIRSLIEKNPKAIILLDYGIDEETLEIVDRMKLEYSNIVLLKEQELSGYLNDFKRSLPV